MTEDYYALNIKQTLKSLNTSEKGLSNSQAKHRIEEYGYNELPKEKKETIFQIFLSQFNNALIYMLIFAGILSLVIGEEIEAIAIFGIILLNAFMGFIQEYRAEKAIEALEKVSAPTAVVIRANKQQKIPAKDLVPGDILVLEEGEIVPADSRVIDSSSLHIDEASLTGESVPSEKVIGEFKKGTPVSDQENMAFMGTTITYGKGLSVVTGTGKHTELGKIASSIQTKDVKTPLQIKFEQLARQLGLIVIGLIVIVFAAGWIKGTLSFGQMLLFAMALTVSTVPYSLPIIVTVSLSLGTKRLAKQNMLIKKIPAAESLGAVTVICSDKTGTITKNQMTVTNIFTSNKLINVTGVGYEPKGDFSSEKKQFNPENISQLLKVAHLCNNAKLVKKGSHYSIIGDPTEGSLVTLAKKGKINESQIKKTHTLVQELPFDSDRKMMSVIYKNKKSKKNEAYVKGAPDILLKKCDRIIVNGKVKKLTKGDKKKILKANSDFAKKALRVLALAYRELPKAKKYNIKGVEKSLIFVGLTGMMDPPREGVPNAIKDCQKAGIRVIVITGDHALTTKAISQKIGLFKKGDLILTGPEIERLSDKQLEKRIGKVRIIARALPIQKSRVVDALKKKGHVVAMTGDGVNDAPALKKADIGISMGITGTDVAKEVSKATLVDDHFATIVKAIKEGRNIYDKMIKSAKYLLSCNAGEITAVLIGILLFPQFLIILPLQILLMNLLTDDFPALGLGQEQSEDDVMDRPPRDPKQKPITGRLFLSIAVFGIVMGLATIFMFMQYKDLDVSKAQTMAFTTLVMIQMFAVISSRSLKFSWKELNPFSNMWLFGAICLSILIQFIVIYWAPMQLIFGTVSLQLMDWLKIIGIAIVGFIAMELSKFLVGSNNNINNAKKSSKRKARNV